MNISGISGIFGIGKARRERAAAYVREAIAEEAATRALIDTRLGEAIDKLEAIVAGVADTGQRNTVELTSRLNRLQAHVHVLRDTVDSLARDLAAEQAARIAGDRRASGRDGGAIHDIPTLADAIAAAPPPDVEEMRAYYAGMREARAMNTAADDRQPEDQPAGML